MQVFFSKNSVFSHEISCCHLFSERNGNSLRQLDAQLVGFLAFFGENRLVTPVLCLSVKVPGPVGFCVVPDLERISAHKDLGRAHEAGKRLLIIAKQVEIAVIRRVARHDEQYWDQVLVAADQVHAVGEVLEDQPLIQRPEGGGQLPKVIRRADDQPVRCPDVIQDRRQAVTADAVPLESFLFASEAGNAARILFETEQVVSFDLRPSRFRALLGFGDQRVRIPAHSQPGVHRDDLLAYDYLHSVFFLVDIALFRDMSAC